MTSAIWLEWCCLFAGAAPDQVTGGRPAQSPGGNDSAPTLWCPSQPFQIRASNMQLASNIQLTRPVPDLHQPVQWSACEMQWLHEKASCMTAPVLHCLGM